MSIQSQLAKAQRTLQRTAAAVHACKGMNSHAVTMHWENPAAATPGYDPSDLSTHPATSATGSIEFRAFVHFVNHTVGTFQRFAEVKSGDVIMDAPAEIDFSGKPNPRFEINGCFYTQKNIGAELAQAWDAFTGNDTATFRTILLKPAN